MRITDNLKDDISNAPSWFLDSLKVEPSELIIKNIKGDLSYSRWNCINESKSLLILIHGTGAHKRWWYPIAPHFMEKTNVVAVDLPGMGDSGFREKYSIKDFGQCIISIIEKEKSDMLIDNVCIVGHSLGGQVAGYVASEKKELVVYLYSSLEVRASCVTFHPRFSHTDTLFDFVCFREPPHSTVTKQRLTFSSFMMSISKTRTSGISLEFA